MKKLYSLIPIFFITISITHAQYSRDNISLGIGPAMLYGDNAGQYRQFRFEVLPALSLSYSRELSDEFDIRATAGVQLIDSGDFGMNSLRVENISAVETQAIHFTGQALFLDVMPVYLFNPTPPGYVGYEFNYYAGAGVGVIYSNRIDQIPMVRERFSDPIVLEEKSNQSIAVYIPLRAGISTNLEGMWDIGVEGTLISAFPSNIDGNTIRHKFIPLDMLLQFQVTLKRYLGR